jgi:hypothetical protein
VLAHQPQPARAEHAEHVVEDAHMSVVVVPPPHDELTQSQSPHDPLVGPVEEPLRQLLELAHQPQPERIAHAEHVVEDAHMSVVVVPPPHAVVV